MTNERVHTVLSPNVPAVEDALAEAYSAIARVDAFAHAAQNTVIGVLSPDPPWLGPMRRELHLLGGCGAQWYQKKPAIWTPLLSHVTNYAALFAGFADASRELGDDRDAWLDALGQLDTSLRAGANAARTAQANFATQIGNLNSFSEVFTASVDKAWAALADEEQQMVELAAQVTALQDRLGELEDDLTSAAVSSGRNYVQSAVTISYELVSTAGVSVPYLSIAGLLFTVGRMAYDLISTDRVIGETIAQIVQLRGRLTEQAQAAAMSKAIIKLIYDFDRALAAIGRRLPPLADMWTAESGKVTVAIDALKAGAVPQQMTELVAMRPAAAGWRSLTDFVTRITAAPAAGRPVTLATR